MNPSVVVVKVGGSLLDWPGLQTALGTFLESRRGDCLILVVGGGRFADVLRELDRSHALGEAASHALALHVLDLTAQVLASLVPGTQVIERIDERKPTWLSGRVPILAPRRFLDDDDHSSDPLPQAWSTTTDSIAARVAVRIAADELVLLKSTTVPLAIDLQEAARLGLVDPEFPRTAAGLPFVTFINLRDPSSGSLNGKGHRPT